MMAMKSAAPAMPSNHIVNWILPGTFILIGTKSVAHQRVPAYPRIDNTTLRPLAPRFSEMPTGFAPRLATNQTKHQPNGAKKDRRERGHWQNCSQTNRQTDPRR